MCHQATEADFLIVGTIPALVFLVMDQLYRELAEAKTDLLAL